MSQTSDPYFCIVALPDQAVADLCVLSARDDAGALQAAAEVARGWPAEARIEIYQRERRVGVLEAAATAAVLPEAA